MHSLKLTPHIIKKLGYYVYLYINPIDNKIFYVGKGRGNRVLEHLKSNSETRAAQIVKEIQANGQIPLIEILTHGLPDEDAAYKIEAAVIDVIGVDNLANAVRGWRSGFYGRMDIKQLVSIYHEERVEIDEPAILIKLIWSYHYGMSDTELYDGTRGVWKLGKRRNNAKYAFAVYEGIVREVYEIQQWFPAGSTFNSRDPENQKFQEYPGRWEFIGRVAASGLRKKYLLKSVGHYWGKHPRSPVIYANC